MYYLYCNGTRIKLEELNGQEWPTYEVVKAAEKKIPFEKRRSLEYCIVHVPIDRPPKICWDQRTKDCGVIPEIFYPQRDKVLT